MYSLTKYPESFHISKSIVQFKTAIFCPTDLPYGMARIYETWSSESPEFIQLFKDKDQAFSWLNEIT